MWKVPLFNISFDEQESRAVAEVLESGWLTMGKTVMEFEKSFADFIGVKYAFAVSSATAGLSLANMALGLGEKDEVVCPSLTFVAGANTIVLSGARPVFADIVSENDLNISPSSVESKVSDKTKAIQVVHYAGYPCDMDEIIRIAKKHNLYIIEDCAHAPGSEYKGKKCGAIGDIGVFSFFSNKNMSTGEGGMLTTNDDEIAEKIKLMRSHGMTSLTLDRHQGHCFSYDVLEIGHNFRFDEMRSAIGLVQLRKLGENNKKREQLSCIYNRELEGVEEILIPFQKNKEKSSHHIFPILLSREVNRNDFMSSLKHDKVQTSIHYPPVHMFKVYKERFSTNEFSLPVVEDVTQREVTLPLYPSMTEEGVKYVSDCIKNYFAKVRG